MVSTLNRDTYDEPRHTPSSCICDSCKLKRFGGASKIKWAVIDNWDVRQKLRFHAVEDDKFDYFLGIELETDNRRYEVDANFAADMKRPYDDFWLAKSDSSVSGPEFASQPGTLAYWRSIKDELAEMFSLLLHAGYTSHNGAHCGMHVNISKNAFESPRHFYRFLTLLHISPRWSIKMSQRVLHQVTEYSHIGGGYRGTNFIGQASLKVTAAGYKTEKYVALNQPEGMEYYQSRLDLTTPLRYDEYGYPIRRSRVDYQDAEGRPAAKRFNKREQKKRMQERLEFRLPRGTLRVDRFFKNLEWTVAMIEYARTHGVAECRPQPFMRWVVLDNLTEYPNLANFIVEKNLMKERI